MTDQFSPKCMGYERQGQPEDLSQRLPTMSGME